jgi:hypothetical protein
LGRALGGRAGGGEGGGCAVHRDHGLWALPDLCVHFPAFGYASPGDGAVELWWDPLCPEVLRQLDESDAPLELHRAAKDAPLWQETGFALRVANTNRTLRARLRAIDLARPDLERIRAESLRALGDGGRPAWRSLAAVLAAYQRLPATGPSGFRAEEPEDPVPFLAFFGGCIGTHGTPLLVWGLEGFRRFSREIDLGPVLAAPAALHTALEA